MDFNFIIDTTSFSNQKSNFRDIKCVTLTVPGEANAFKFKEAYSFGTITSFQGYSKIKLKCPVMF